MDRTSCGSPGLPRNPLLVRVSCFLPPCSRTRTCPRTLSKQGRKGGGSVPPAPHLASALSHALWKRAHRRRLIKTRSRLSCHEDTPSFRVCSEPVTDARVRVCRSACTSRGFSLGCTPRSERPGRGPRARGICRIPPPCSPQRPRQFAPPAAASVTLGVLTSLITAHPMGVKCYLVVVSICISLLTSDRHRAPAPPGTAGPRPPPTFLRACPAFSGRFLAPGF